MKRLAWLATAAAALLLTACQNQTKKPEPRVEETQTPPLDKMESTPAPEDSYASSGTAYPLEQPSAAAKPAKKSGETLTPGSGQTYVVQKGDTLYGIARKVYNDPSKWKKIWEANKARIPNKDKLTVGTKLIIP